MMKSIATLGILFTLFAANLSCKKTAESVIDCLGESLMTSVEHTTDGTDPKKINFSVNYFGDHEITSINWDFGDTHTQTTTGNTVSHTYSASGTFSLKVKVNIKDGRRTCSVEPKKSITIP